MSKRSRSKNTPCSKHRQEKRVAKLKERKRERKLLVLERDEWRCYLCGVRLGNEPGTDEWGREIRRMTIDHVRAKSKGGSNDPRNLRACCESCNHRKGASHVDVAASDEVFRDPNLEQVLYVYTRERGASAA